MPSQKNGFQPVSDSIFWIPRSEPSRLPTYLTNLGFTEIHNPTNLPTDHPTYQPGNLPTEPISALYLSIPTIWCIFLVIMQPTYPITSSQFSILSYLCPGNPGNLPTHRPDLWYTTCYKNIHHTMVRFCWLTRSDIYLRREMYIVIALTSD